jgi:hypothetical protein
MAKLILSDVRSVLNRRISIATAKSDKRGPINLDYHPLDQQFRVYQNGDLDNVYSAFGAQMAIDRFNDLVGQ